MPVMVSKKTKEKSKLTKEEWREYTKTVWHIANTSDREHPAVFPVEIPKRLIKLFTFYGETVLDPFAGMGTTAQAGIPLGRRVICVDENASFVRTIRSRARALHNGRSGKEMLLAMTADSRRMPRISEESVSLVVTSPPYWNKATYGGNSRNLGNVQNYRTFLGEVHKVFSECYRVLQPGRKMCVVTANVNQHTDEGLLTFPLAADYIVSLRDIGFVMVNEIIWSKDGTGGKWGSSGAQRPIFGSYPYPPNFLFKNVHEYVLIFAKPRITKVRGPKVKPYRELIGLE